MKILQMYIGMKIIIPLTIITLIVTYIIYINLKFKFNKKFRQNCFKCKNYNLFNVASAGGWCKYECSKYNRIDEHAMNDKYNFRKCNDFEIK